MLKRIIKKLLIFIIPFVLGVAFFVAFEPYNYWLIKDNSSYLGRAVYSVRRLKSGRCKNIILGNSLMANWNEDYIEQISGVDYDNLAYGGASLYETVEEFWYAAEHCDLERVVIGVNFYTMNTEMRSETRFQNTVKLAENPLSFIGGASYWSDAITNFNVKGVNLIADVTGNEQYRRRVDDPSSMNQNLSTEEIAIYNQAGEREDIKAYGATIYDQCAEYGFNFDYIDALTEIADYCNDNDIEIIFVISNCNKVLWDNVIYKVGLESYMAKYKDALKSCATVYDFEFDNEQAANDDVYLDGMHLVRDEKMRLIRVVFGGEADKNCMITAKEDYIKNNA